MDFVVGHPRSGTALLAELLDSARPGISRHEHLCKLEPTFITVASDHHAGRASKADVLALVRAYGRDGVAIDSNWKLTWVLDVLVEAFPEARFLQLTREPQANIAACMSLDYYGEVMRTADPARLMKILGSAEAVADAVRWYSSFPEVPGADRFERNCRFWVETHRLILDKISARPGYLRLRLEDLKDPAAAGKITDFFGLPAANEAVLTRYVNDHQRLRDLLASLREGPADPVGDVAPICGPMAKLLGY